MKQKLLITCLCLVGWLMPSVAWAEVEINEANFPDANFRAILMELPEGKDGVFTDKEIAWLHNLYFEGERCWYIKMIRRTDPMIIDTIVVGSRAFRALNVVNEEEGIGQNWWVEGVGSMGYLSSSFLYPGNYYTFLQCQLGTDLLFSQKEFGTLGVHNTTVDSIKASYSTLYTLDGLRLTTPPTKGIYIQNGRKVVK